MRKIFTSLLVAAISLLIISSFAPLALAQASTEGIKLDDVKVSVMPEYDDPRVLVIVESTLSQGVKLPLDVRFLVPDSATNAQIGMACEVVESQGHRCKVYNTEAKSGYREITYDVNQSHNLFIEYYYDLNSQDNGDKSFTFDYIPSYDVKHLEIEVKQPLKATNFKIDPSSNNQTTDEQGFKNFVYSYDNVVKEKPISFKVSYNKTDPNPSVQKNQSQVLDSNAESQQSSNTGLMRTMLVLVFALFVGGVVVAFWRAKAAQPTAVGGRAARNVKRQVKPKAASAAKRVKYCSSCGQSLKPTDKFCPGCGEKIRS